MGLDSREHPEPHSWFYLGFTGRAGCLEGEKPHLVAKSLQGDPKASSTHLPMLFSSNHYR